MPSPESRAANVENPYYDEQRASIKKLVIVNPGLIDSLEIGDSVMDWDREKSSVTDENGKSVGYIDQNDGVSIHIWIDTDELNA